MIGRAEQFSGLGILYSRPDLLPHFLLAWHALPPTGIVGVGQLHRCGFLRCGQQVEHGIGRTAHGHVQGHGVFKGFEASNVAWQYAVVVLLVVAFGQVDD